MRVGGGKCAYVPLVFQSPLRTVLPLLSVSCGDSQIYWRGTRKLKRRDSRERGSEAIYMYCSLDRFCDSLSKCHFWFASDAWTVVLCTHSLDVCVCVGRKCVGEGVCGMRVKEVCMRGERSKVGQEEALSTNEPVVRLISMVPQRIFPSAVPPYPK